MQCSTGRLEDESSAWKLGRGVEPNALDEILESSGERCQWYFRFSVLPCVNEIQLCTSTLPLWQYALGPPLCSFAAL